MSKKESPFHSGERAIHSRLGLRDETEKLGRKLIRDHMPMEHQELFAQLSLFFVATSDAGGRPWASPLVGSPGFVRAIDSRTLRVSASALHGDVLEQTQVEGAQVGGLGLDFSSRRRNRVNGWFQDVEKNGFSIRVAQSFGNCPQYIQARTVTLKDRTDPPQESSRVRITDTLGRAEATLVADADTFFVASQFGAHGSDPTRGVDVSHRGGRPGFVLVAHETSLLFPDYPGNCMFSTLGNLHIDPRCGLLFIDFDSGSLLQLTGRAEALWEPHHVSRFPGAQRVVSFSVEEARFIEGALPATAEFKSHSSAFHKLPSLESSSPRVKEPASWKLLSVNVSAPQEVVHGEKTVSTGIFKQPIHGRTMLRRLNLDRDAQADLLSHGGTFRAAYVYTVENYDYWRRELGQALPFGTFGENFTVEGMLDEQVCIGDILRIGGALTEVSQPRVPCYKLSIKMGHANFDRRFLQYRQVGFYLRVLEEGEVGAGDTIELVSRDPRRMSVQEVNSLLFFEKDDLEGARRALSVPALAHGWKGSFQERLAKVQRLNQTQTGFRPFRVERKVAESETITSFYLVPNDDQPLDDFLPGQFLTFRLDIPGESEPLIRTYSLSDAPGRSYYRVSIKREGMRGGPTGRSSGFFHDYVKPGDVLNVAPPRGKFHLDANSKRTLVLLSAGVGLTPLMSMANAVVESRVEREVWFVHGARNGREHAMGEHVRSLAERHAGFHAYVRYSMPDAADAGGRDYDSAGRIDIGLLKQILPFDDFEFYLCGPAPFMKALYCGLISMGVQEERIHYEFFGPGSILTEEAKPIEPNPDRTRGQPLTEEIQVSFARSGLSVPWDPEVDTLLELAERHGLDPDYSCRSGICQTCICDLIEGSVEYLEDPLDPPDANRVLICCSRPRGHVTIDI